MGKTGMPEMVAPNKPEIAQPRCPIVLPGKSVNAMICRHIVNNAGALW